MACFSPHFMGHIKQRPQGVVFYIGILRKSFEKLGGATMENITSGKVNENHE